MSTNPIIQRSTLAYLRDLRQHDNDRDWFEANRARYERALANMRAFADALILHMDQHDRIATPSGAKALMRIYNDRRFHKERPLYKSRFAGSLARVKPALRGGYYFRVQPGDSYLGCGFWNPEKEDLLRIRLDILYDHEVWEQVLQQPSIRTHWGALEPGRPLKTAPQGFPKEHPAIELLRRKQFVFGTAISDEQVMAPDFVERVSKRFKVLRPWLDHLSEVLTSDENGTPL